MRGFPDRLRNRSANFRASPSEWVAAIHVRVFNVRSAVAAGTVIVAGGVGVRIAAETAAGAATGGGDASSAGPVAVAAINKTADTKDIPEVTGTRAVRN